MTDRQTDGQNAFSSSIV